MSWVLKMYDSNMHGERIKIVSGFVVVCTSLLPVFLCTVHNKTESREVHTTTTQIESTATCPDKVVTKTTMRRVALQQEQPLKTIKDIDRNM